MPKLDISGTYFWKLFFLRIRLLMSLNGLIKICCRIRGLTMGSHVKFLGFPRIRRYPNSRITIGNNCSLNSAKHAEYIALHRPCTLVTLKDEAEIIVGDNVGMTAVAIGSASKVKIGNNVKIGALTTIFDTDFHHSDPAIRLNNDVMPTSPVTIEDNVFIGYNCLVLKGVTIGKNSVIGANSVVINNIPENSVAIGNPCRTIIRRNWDSDK